jgi:hypothetical protein
VDKLSYEESFILSEGICIKVYEDPFDKEPLEFLLGDDGLYHFTSGLFSVSEPK